MADSDSIDSQVTGALQRIGLGGAREVRDELDDVSLSEIEATLERLAAQGRIELVDVPIRAYRVTRPIIDWARHTGKVTVIHNDPIDILMEAHKACNLHPSVEHASLEAVFSALVSGAKVQLQIISPFVDSRALSRFREDFETAFSRHIAFTLVGRGILAREDSTRPRQYRGTNRGAAGPVGVGTTETTPETLLVSKSETTCGSTLPPMATRGPEGPLRRRYTTKSLSRIGSGHTLGAENSEITRSGRPVRLEFS